MTKTTVDVDVFLSPTELAKRLKVSTGHLANRRSMGRGPTFVKIGASVRYRESDVADWLETNTHDAASSA